MRRPSSPDMHVLGFKVHDQVLVSHSQHKHCNARKLFTSLGSRIQGINCQHLDPAMLLRNGDDILGRTLL